MILEIAANSVASALAAQAGGASRVELCSALELGGLTPSPSTIAMVRERLQIPVYVLIRPRAGDFLYNDLECEAMLRDIEYCTAQGCEGVVIGVLNADGHVDKARCQPLVDAAGKLGVTFHRAFDLAHTPAQALEDIIALGCERVLTSGGKATALEGAEAIRQWIEQAAGRIAIMPGAGVSAQNVAALKAATGASEFHASAKEALPSGMRWQPDGLRDMQGGEWRSEVEQVGALVAALAPSSPDQVRGRL